MRLFPDLRANRPGFMMIEVLGALLIMAMLWHSLTWLIQKESIARRQRAVAEHFVVIVSATEKYLRQNHDTLLADSTDTTGPVIPLATLRTAQCLSDRVTDLNAWGQSYLVTTRKTAEGDLAGVVITTGGRSASADDPTFGQVTVPETAALARAGFIPVDPGNVLQGYYGNWNIALADMGLTGTPGHLGILTTLDSQDLKQDYLYRFAVPGHPELNAMQTELDMTDHAIRGVKELQYAPHSFETMPDFCATEADEGRTFLDSEKGLYLCRDGNIQVVSDTGNSLPIQTATLATDAQIIEKPICPAGSATHPEIFVTPSITAAATNATDAAKVKPMHSVQAWAVNYPATDPNAASWQVKMRVLTSDNTWIYPTPNYGRVVVFTSCAPD
jgi:type II secretory pathway pseudopilin PulG